VPLYPQYSVSATQSVLDLAPGLPSVREFHAHPRYIAALASTVSNFWKNEVRGERLLMSFHGLPKRGAEEYETQCRETARLLAEQLNLQNSAWQVTFQSRFGFAKWLEPYTQPTLETLGRGGIGRVDVVCPGFVSDCLETLEEIAITARDAFIAAGGKELRVIPCLNEAPEWIEAVAAIARST
jgi:ferrochelatase